MSKHNKKQPKLNLAPAALLCARLERQWRDPATAGQPASQVEAGLAAVTQGLRPEAVLSAMLSVFPTAPAEVQAALQSVLPGWLASRNSLDALERMLASEMPDGPRTIAMGWLAAAGRDVVSLTTRPGGSFHSAYDLDDGSQAAVIVLWYTNPHGNRVRGIQLLIDHNPPWEGAIKDAFLLPSKTPEAIIRRYVDTWGERWMDMLPLGAAEVKRKLLLALAANRSAEVRLPRDLIVLREHFVEQILSLPDLPDTPPFTAEDFDALSVTGKSAESLSEFELTVGRRIRMEDGKEILIDASLANQDFDDWDDDDG
jgi:hypothetical protein